MKGKFQKFVSRLIIIAGVLLLIATGVLLFFKLEGEKPSVSINGLTSAIRASHEMSISLSDQKSGIRNILVTVEQGGKVVELFRQELPAVNPLMGGEVREKQLSVTIEPKKEKLVGGKAVFRLTATDYSWRNWFRGNRTMVEKNVLIDYRPPRIVVLSNQHNLNQGGAGMVAYQLSEPCPVHGVYVGDRFFPGQSLPPLSKGRKAGNKNRFAALIAVGFQQSKDVPVFVSAVDQAGNQGKSGFYHFIKTKKFREDTIRLSDRFLNLKLPEFEDDLNGTDAASPIEKFLIVNRRLRKENTSRLKKITETSDSTIHWEGSFLRLPNSARRAAFADHRTYIYDGKKVDEQYHMGVDLASTALAPVLAANSGKVVFVDDVGIYGGTIIIDHGLGLFSLYSHLSSFDAAAGQMVKKGDVIGRTGMTGMAGGDHLHFGMLVRDVFVNPVEWWDKSWLKNNIIQKINLVR